MQPFVVKYCYKRKLLIPLFRYSLFRVLQAPIKLAQKSAKVKFMMALYLKVVYMMCVKYVQSFMLLSISAQLTHVLSMLLYYI